MSAMISLEAQIEGMKMLDAAYIDWKKHKSLIYSDKLYEHGFATLRAIVGMKKLREIAQKGGSKDSIRKEQILFLFTEYFDKL